VKWLDLFPEWEDRNMSRLKKIVSLVISVCLFSLTILPFNGYCDDWVKYGSNENFTLYYKSSSVKIYNNNNIIKLWDKTVYTEKGKIWFLNSINSPEKIKLLDIHHTLSFYYYDYKEWKSCMTHRTHYSESGDVLYDQENPPKWDIINPNTYGDIILKKLLKDNNIQK
jgi:hypothetical protein